MNQHVIEIGKQIEELSVSETLIFLGNEYSGQITFSTSLGQEDQVITHLIEKSQADIEIFTLDTGRLFPETYDVLGNTKSRYKTPIKVYFPNTQAVENLITAKGPNSFYNSVENRKECCAIRKIEPLKRALEGKKIWITGLRAGQSNNRQNMNILEYDKGFDIIKYNPLLNWSLEEVENYLTENKVPQNVLHKNGFVSIGCQPCTRPIEEGEDIRAGRWWWELSSKECGLHA